MRSAAPSPPLVSAAWLADAMSSGEPLVVADVRWRLGEGPRRAEYLEGHLPGAVFVDLDGDLSAPPSPDRGRHPLPDPTTFAARRTALGMGDGVTVVAYDDAGGATAARLWWMLTVLGQPAAVLDGGLGAWEGPVETGPVATVPRRATPAPWPADAVATLEEIEAVAAGAGTSVLLDARAAARYRGDVVAVDPRPGHIPGARSADLAGNLTPDGRFLAPEVLERRYRDLGAGEPGAGGADVIVSCGSGVTACHDALAMVVAGLARPRLYVGSYSQWSADPTRPVETGDAGPGAG